MVELAILSSVSRSSFTYVTRCISFTCHPFYTLTSPLLCPQLTFFSSSQLLNDSSLRRRRRRQQLSWQGFVSTYRSENCPADRDTQRALSSLLLRLSMSPVDLPYSRKANCCPPRPPPETVSGRARLDKYFSYSERDRQKHVPYSVLFKRKAFHSVIVPVSDIEMAMTIEGQTSGTTELIGSVSTYHDSALRCSTTPAHHSIIVPVCHIHITCCIDPHSTRTPQLRQIVPFASSTGHDNTFFGALRPFHHTMILVVRHEDSVFFIHTDVVGIIELMETHTFPISTSHHDATRLSSAIASHFMLLCVSDIERSLVIHCQSPTIDVVADRFSNSRATSTRPPCYSPVIWVADDETVCFSVEDHICRPSQRTRLISLSVTTGQYCATPSTLLPFHDAMIPPVGNDHRVLVIHKDTFWPVELVCPTPFPVASSDSDTALCPPNVGCNGREETMRWNLYSSSEDEVEDCWSGKLTKENFLGCPD